MRKITDKASNKYINDKQYISYFELNPKISIKKGVYSFKWDEKLLSFIKQSTIEEDVHYGFIRKIDFIKYIDKIMKNGIIDKYQQKLFLIGQQYIDGFRWMIEGKRKINSFENSALFPINSMSFHELIALLVVSFPSIFRYKKNILLNSPHCTFLEYIKWLSATNQKYIAEKYMKMYNNINITGGFDDKIKFTVIDDNNEDITTFYRNFRKDLDMEKKYTDIIEDFTIYKFFYTMEKIFNIDMFYSNFLLQRLIDSGLIFIEEENKLKPGIILSQDIKEKFVLYAYNQNAVERETRNKMLYSLIDSVKKQKFIFKCNCGGTCIKIDKNSLKCLKCRNLYIFPYIFTNKDFWKVLLIKNGRGIYFSKKGRRMFFRMQENEEKGVFQCMGEL